MRASTCQPGSGRKGLNRLRYLAEPLLRFDLDHELQQLRREESWERETGRSSKTLAKYPDFRIVLVCMKAGSHINDHRAEARISIQALEGKILLHVPDQKPIELSAGQLMTLDCGIHHDVEALVESAFLLTISWRKDTATSAEEFTRLSGPTSHLRKRTIEPGASGIHITADDDNSGKRDYLGPTLEEFADKHCLPIRWLQLRKACDRLAGRADFWYRPELLNQARRLAVEASDILTSTLGRGNQLTGKESQMSVPLNTLDKTA